jgi:hypothetical protein
MLSNGIVSEVYEKIGETGMPWATAMPPISVRYICRKSKRRGLCCAVEKIHDGEPSLAASSLLAAKIYSTTP